MSASRGLAVRAYTPGLHFGQQLGPTTDPVRRGGRRWTRACVHETHVPRARRRRPAQSVRTDDLIHPFREFAAAVPPLHRFHQISRSAYVGPTEESNWVIPGRLLVGAYPSVSAARAVMSALASAAAAVSSVAVVSTPRRAPPPPSPGRARAGAR